MKLDLYQVDAFTYKLFRGNPAAVCPLDKWLDEEVMQNIAAENNLSETAFFVKENDTFRIRWFTPEAEVDLCGHATLASAHVLFNHLDFQNDTIAFQSNSGGLSVHQDRDYLVLNFPADNLESTNLPEQLSSAFNFQPADSYKGRSDYLVLFENQRQIQELLPDFQKIKASGARGVVVTAPGTDVDFVSRFFAPAVGIDEDPVTGSAHTTLTPFWAERLGKTEMTAKQISKRQGYLKCTLLGDRVEIAGQAVTYLIGKIDV